MKNNLGYRGYITSRKIDGNFIPQTLQNLKIRDFAKKLKIEFKLSATEYVMKNSYHVLNSLRSEANELEGVIFFSIFALPEKRSRRNELLRFFIKKKKVLYFALEELKVKTNLDIKEIEEVYFIRNSTKN